MANDDLATAAIAGIAFLGIGCLTLFHSFNPKLGSQPGMSWSDRREWVRYLRFHFPGPMRKMAAIQIALAMLWNTVVFAFWLMRS